MKNINQFITEYIIKKKLDEPIDSEDHYTYFPNTKEELISNIDELLDKEISDFNCINTSKIRNMSNLFFYKNFNRKQKSILKDRFCENDKVEPAWRYSRELEHSDVNINRMEEIINKYNLIDLFL